ncbi:hypothetical protein GLAREA_01631 [Glarea lozoyensis ATCC 20868]|uniref:Uncharacterized protein n=1 Tax=Glarea lozoyensis (strain ATCC 20868 / MF5171) TaxID=1116229 RepID=S3CKI9_GLAL2|nr:uncharacterized protein GLAREA_01631 [Glarea lozoyensis ATCC 20868]EPE25719.1 hypothetical protein GLAREA_01631 [Glarea lozoyensis ATCC 20868]
MPGHKIRHPEYSGIQKQDREHYVGCIMYAIILSSVFPHKIRKVPSQSIQKGSVDNV